jgi:hypothetical protein
VTPRNLGKQVPTAAAPATFEQRIDRMLSAALLADEAAQRRLLGVSTGGHH